MNAGMNFAVCPYSGVDLNWAPHVSQRWSPRKSVKQLAETQSDKRANAVKETLVAGGVSSANVKTISFGKEKPVCEEHDESCWQQNRRGHFSR
jgi:outer membrane protein OmpA-like peptidoglycan-associated protein